MSSNNILFNDEGKNLLIEGVNLIGDAVKTTFGPNGKNVIIKGSSGLYITKDGATVARYVASDNPFIDSGIELIKGIATKTATDIGDGTSTATILAQALVNSLKDCKDNPITVSRDLDKEVKVVVDYLEKNKRTIDNLEDLIKVASVSTNNDEELGKLVAETYFKVTKDGVVNVEDSQDINTHVVFSQGAKVESGYLSPFFINSPKGICELENTYVAIFRSPLNDVKEVTPACEKAIRLKKSLLIIAPKIDSSIVRTLIINKDSGNLKSCCIPCPGHGIYRDNLLNDLENILGDEMFCDRVIISKDITTIIGGTPKQEIVEGVISNLKETTVSKGLSEFEINFAKKRLANYIGGIATIKVGGYYTVEIQEKKDRLDDAIGSVKAAMESGILPGGGISLYRAAIRLDLKYLKQILIVPFNLLQGDLILKEGGNWLDVSNFWEGINFKTQIKGDMYEMGIVDPFLVTKIALENAVSVASLILTNGCAIITN